jgi:hypothetical protein
MFVMPYALAILLGLVVTSGVFPTLTEDSIDKFFIVFQEPVMFIPPVLVYMLITGYPIGEIVPHKKLSFKNVLAVIGLTLLFMPTMSLFSNITAFFVDDTVNTEIFDMIQNLSTPVSIVSFAIMPAIFEELIFRGVIMTGHKRNGMLKAVCISGLFFGMMHMDWFQLPYTFVGGMVFAIFVYCTNSIYSSMIAHFVLNGIQIIGSILYIKLSTPEELSEAATSVMTLQDKMDALVSSATAVVFTLPFFIIFLKMFIKRNKENSLEYRYGIYDEHLNIDISNIEKKEKSADKFFVLSILLYIGFMIVQTRIMKG